MTVIAIILAGSTPLQFSSPRDLVVNMRQPHFARVRASRNCATNAGREIVCGICPCLPNGGGMIGGGTRLVMLNLTATSEPQTP